MKEFNNDYRMPAYGNEKTPQQVIAEQRQIISEMQEALSMFLKNMDRWIKTGIPADEKESEMIYTAAKTALENSKK